MSKEFATFATKTDDKPNPEMSISTQLPEKYVITIGRSFGAGGRELGRLLADKLGISYYDKELLNEAARHAGMSESIFEKNDERAPGFLSGLLPLNPGYSTMAWYGASGGASCERVYQAQSDFIHSIADKGPCVIVGRTADYVLRDRRNVLNIFLHAPEEVCIDRITLRDGNNDRDRARSIMRKTNRLRSEFYNFYTDRRWGHAATYHLTLDSSAMPMEDLADFVIAYLRKYLGRR